MTVGSRPRIGCETAIFSDRVTVMGNHGERKKYIPFVLTLLSFATGIVA
jgi:hypothetical protein